MIGSCIRNVVFIFLAYSQLAAEKDEQRSWLGKCLTYLITKETYWTPHHIHGKKSLFKIFEEHPMRCFKKGVFLLTYIQTLKIAHELQEFGVHSFQYFFYEFISNIDSNLI